MKDPKKAEFERVLKKADAEFDFLRQGGSYTVVVERHSHGRMSIRIVKVIKGVL